MVYRHAFFLKITSFVSKGERVGRGRVLSYFNFIQIPSASAYPVWLGRTNSNWNTTTICLAGSMPNVTDSIRVSPCNCTMTNCMTLLVGNTIISGMTVMEETTITVPMEATLTIHGHLTNHGHIDIYGTLSTDGEPQKYVHNYGTIDCKSGGQMIVND